MTPTRSCTYILASRPRGTLFFGVTSDLLSSIESFRKHPVVGMRRRCDVFRLVWFEFHDNELDAADRDRELRHWNRLWVLKLIESLNPDWRDLYEDVCNKNGDERVRAGC